MNDFTKEELGSIFLDMNYNILKYGKKNIEPFYLNLRNKIEAMIDNYCEHEMHSYGDISVLVCKKCKHLSW